MTPKDLDVFLVKVFMWTSKFKLASIVIPKHFKESFIVTELLLKWS